MICSKSRQPYIHYTMNQSDSLSSGAGREMRMVRQYGLAVALFILLWMVKGAEQFIDFEFTHLGIYPLSAQGLIGILTAPLVHADIGHLANNAFSLLVLGGLMSYFYPTLFFKVLLLGWLITGSWVWVFARDAWHIGASGLVYSLASFLLISGLIRRNPNLLAITLLVVFLYGGLTWGVFPVQQHISWESHLMGMISGILLAIFFRKHGPPQKKYSWDDEPDDSDTGPSGTLFLEEEEDDEYGKP